ncbi:splicing factor YJU2-like isoform X1 [Silurus meridionalis]|uniref:Uncharacterized protein n=1 Tax=Silurus meridionalis TaxID=175797 RepID=A0A8T0ALA8_SILME|nr:splicing factor YJU2-like isoform X1 [Silurus meridionalis]KAF7692506.1 hypothetical protein HF521_010116 [Silurus meridionalis]
MMECSSVYFVFVPVLKQTDPENNDYRIESGATRNFQVLENPKRGLKDGDGTSREPAGAELAESATGSGGFESMLQQSRELEKRRKEQKQEEIERELQEMLEMARTKRLKDSESDSNSDSDQEQENMKKMLKTLKKACAYEKSTDILTAGTETYTKRLNVFGVKRKKCEFYSWGELKSLVSRKKPAAIARAQQPVAGTQTGIDAKPAEGTATALSLLQEYESSDSD